MATKRPRRFWIEAGLAALAGFLFLLTLVWRDWLEEVFGWDPDHHNGSVEWIIVGGLLVITLLLSGAARLEWQRTRHMGEAVR